jgi:hypothetical protein
VRNLKQIFKSLTWDKVVLAVITVAIAITPVLAMTPQVTKAQLINQFAQNCPQGTGVRCSEGNLGAIFVTIINWALAIAFILAVIFLIYGGFQYILSGGNEELAKNGRQAIFNALVGIVIIVLSYVIVQIVYRFVSGSGGGSIFPT